MCLEGTNTLKCNADLQPSRKFLICVSDLQGAKLDSYQIAQPMERPGIVVLG